MSVFAGHNIISKNYLMCYSVFLYLVLNNIPNILIIQKTFEFFPNFYIIFRHLNIKKKMQLFKRILLSLFPEQMVNQPINPASMFISFISAKQFFSVVNRKVVENYKLNLFDISLDSFDVKIWFGENPTIKVKDIDFYYSYWVVSNFNGYRFFSPANIWICMVFLSSIYTKDSFEWEDLHYLNDFLINIFLITFVFISRIKVFPFENDQQNYKWFIEVFFNFFKEIIAQNGKTIDDKKFEEMKNKLIKENIQVFFMLFYFYKRLNQIFFDKRIQEKEFYNLLFYDELKKWNYKFLLLDFVDNYAKYTRNEIFSTTEKKVINLVLPADLLIKYLYDGDDTLGVIEYVTSSIYDKKILDEYINSFLKSDEKLEELIEYMTNYHLFKRKYFKWVKKYIVNKFKNQTYDIDDEIDEFISQVWDNENPENIKIPERIKKESNMMERFINFYLTFLWWFWISRWDNFYLRLFRRNILEQILDTGDILEMKQDALFFFGWLLYNYSKNVFYYKYALDNVRAGKEKFNLPFRSTFKEVYSNTFILRLFDENFIWSILQDINGKDIKIYVQNKEILSYFKDLFADKISQLVKMDNQTFVKTIYDRVSFNLKNIKNFSDILYANFSEKDISNIKENVYTFDFWVWVDILEKLNSNNVDLTDKYSDFSILGIVAVLRDTIFGFVLYLKYLEIKNLDFKSDIKINVLKKIYILDVIWISDEYLEIFVDIIDQIKTKYSDILTKWINMDDNKQYLKIWEENWKDFVDTKTDESIFADIGGEDVIWFRWFLKNITFYNKRYLISKD